MWVVVKVEVVLVLLFCSSLHPGAGREEEFGGALEMRHGRLVPVQQPRDGPPVPEATRRVADRNHGILH